MSAVGYSLRDLVGDSVRAPVSSVGGLFRNSVGDSVRDPVGDSVKDWDGDLIRNRVLSVGVLVK